MANHLPRAVIAANLQEAIDDLSDLQIVDDGYWKQLDAEVLTSGNSNSLLINKIISYSIFTFNLLQACYWQVVRIPLLLAPLHPFLPERILALEQMILYFYRKDLKFRLAQSSWER